MEYIMGFSHSGKPVKDLSRIKRLLHAVGDPQERLRFVHIAGTNGKGSMAQMFSEGFICSGLKTGLFTSPYILEYSDRIRVNGENISQGELEELAAVVKKAIESLGGDKGFSQFEITQAIAFLHFERQSCDVVVLETGLGGLLDCTNVVNTSVLTVIGSVDYDHTAILGDTLEEIAAQKAGIIKPQVPCVLSAGNDMRVVDVVSRTAAEKGAQLVIPDLSLMKLGESGIFGTRFEYRGREYSTAMGGYHQVLNAMSVIEGFWLIKDGFELDDDSAAMGISRAVIHGRAEVVSHSPLTVLDGAHNPDGMGALAKVIESSGKLPCRAVIGMCRDKSIAEAVSKLIPFVERFVTVDGFSERAESAEVLAEIISNAGGKAYPAVGSIAGEIRKMQNENPDGLCLICGSLFLVSDVLHSWGQDNSQDRTEFDGGK